MGTAVERATDSAARPVLDRIASGALPGAVLGMVAKSGERAVTAAGAAQLEPEHARMTRETVFDLASLTKVLFTTPNVLALVARGQVALDQPLSELIPDLRQHDLDAPERRLTVRQCLTHQTFLPAHEPLYTLGLDPATLRAHILQKPWTAGPAVYADLNFMLLGIMLERVNGLPLAEHPLPAGFTFTPDPDRCAATERCPWRGRVLRGEVHDENAFAFGGASGHAGLFAGIDAVLDFAQDLLNEPTAMSLRRETGERTLGGWLVPAPGTIGHTGFTGTSLCLDFERGIAWSLLTNRVHPTRHRPNPMPSLRGDVTARILAEF
jgi:CubicO group peptidase (beta-lactamase class C family)